MRSGGLWRSSCSDSTAYDGRGLSDSIDSHAAVVLVDVLSQGLQEGNVVLVEVSRVDAESAVETEVKVRLTLALNQLIATGTGQTLSRRS